MLFTAISGLWLMLIKIKLLLFLLVFAVIKRNVGIIIYDLNSENLYNTNIVIKKIEKFIKLKKN